MDVRLSRIMWLLPLALCAACGDADVPSAVPPEEPLTTHASGIQVSGIQPGIDQTSCIHRRLDNAEPGFVRKVRGSLSEGSHHMIAYISEETEEQLDPQPCGAFSGIFVFDEGGVPGLDSANVPIFIAQQPHVELTMPTDEGRPVGFRVAAHQMLRLELHGFNTSSEVKDVEGEVELDVLPESLAKDVIESSFAFWGTADIALPPHEVTETPVLFQRALAHTKVFAVTTHEHHLGTRMRIWHSDGSGGADDSRLLLDSHSWADPPLAFIHPPLAFGDSEGLAYRCEWNNTTNQQVGFGEDFDDEMCFLWAYYYPSDGFDICLHFAQGAQQGVCNHLIR